MLASSHNYLRITTKLQNRSPRATRRGAEWKSWKEAATLRWEEGRDTELKVLYPRCGGQESGGFSAAEAPEERGVPAQGRSPCSTWLWRSRALPGDEAGCLGPRRPRGPAHGLLCSQTHSLWAPAQRQPLGKHQPQGWRDGWRSSLWRQGAVRSHCSFVELLCHPANLVEVGAKPELSISISLANTVHPAPVLL